MDIEEESIENSDDSDYLWSDEEGEIRQLVLGLPALSVSESLTVDGNIRNQASVPAKLIVAAAEEEAGKKDQNISENPQIKKLGQPRVLLDAVAGVSGSKATDSMVEGEPMKKAKNESSTQLTHPPQGPPKCHICGKGFVSWKAVFAHLRLHKDRGYQGFFPPPTFNTAEEGFGGTVSASSGAGRFGLGTGALDEEGSVSKSTPKFDLNRSPPHEEEE